MPSLKDAKVKAGSAVCLSNIKQLQIAHFRYTTENDFTYPCSKDGSVYGGNTSENHFRRASKLVSYLGDDIQAFKCPGDIMNPNLDFTRRHKIVSYGINISIHGYTQEGNNHVKKMHKLEPEASTVMGFADEAGNIQNGFARNGDDWLGVWHGKTANAGAMDGSARVLRMTIPTSWTVVEQLASTGANNLNAVRNNSDNEKLKKFMSHDPDNK